MLVVEDDRNQRELPAGFLRMAGLDVDTAGDGLDALEHLHARSRPDMVLLDMGLPLRRPNHGQGNPPRSEPRRSQDRGRDGILTRRFWLQREPHGHRPLDSQADRPAIPAQGT